MTTRTTRIGSQDIHLETGRLAKQADGAVVVRLGDTMVLVTVCCASTPKALSFLPLTVEYRENTYAAGRIPGGFFKREGRPTEKETLTCRAIDRPLRPLFPVAWRNETQIIANVVSADAEHDADVLAITGASAALALSSVPVRKTVAAARVCLIEGRYVVNPTFTERRLADLELLVAGTKDRLVMVEGAAREATESQVLLGLVEAQHAIGALVDSIDALAQSAGSPKRQPPPSPVDDETADAVTRVASAPLLAAMRVKGQQDNVRAVRAVVENTCQLLAEGDVTRRAVVLSALDDLKDRLLHRELLDGRRRLDDRTLDQVRPIDIEVGVLPRTHGSAVFTRGETQALVTCTLGTTADAQRVEGLVGESTRRFLLHYNFPPFSVGEVAFLRGPGRREIGHGALAERALAAVMPDASEFPYTVRLVSDILEANGSSSMATVCGSTLALMEAGVPLRAPDAGVAMGLVMDDTSGRHAVLTDIAGAEDHYGDMDLKVAGTAAGITAIQMDIKVDGISPALLGEALEQARQGRLFILERMTAALPAPRPAVSARAPRIVTLQIPVSKIRDVIGPGGKMIRSIVERTGARIDVDNDGRVHVASSDEASAQQAIAIIQELTATPEIGRNYLGRVQRITDFGAFIEIMPGIDGLLHVSEIADHRVQDVRDELAEGQQVLVKVISIDPTGKVRLSRKALLARTESASEAPAATNG
jgi:polyribonucleotide nucleotidyltransferase